MKIRVNELDLKPYADTSFGKPIRINFEFSDIRNAIEEKRFDKRSFQGDFDELQNEWNNNSTYEEYLEKSKQYHIERIAYLIESGNWKIPISVESNLKTIRDGQHRVWAAKFLNEEEIDAEVFFD